MLLRWGCSRQSLVIRLLSVCEAQKFPPEFGDAGFCGICIDQDGVAGGDGSAQPGLQGGDVGSNMAAGTPSGEAPKEKAEAVSSTSGDAQPTRREGTGAIKERKRNQSRVGSDIKHCNICGSKDHDRTTCPERVEQTAAEQKRAVQHAHEKAGKTVKKQSHAKYAPEHQRTEEYHLFAY